MYSTRILAIFATLAITAISSKNKIFADSNELGINELNSDIKYPDNASYEENKDATKTHNFNPNEDFQNEEENLIEKIFDEKPTPLNYQSPNFPQAFQNFNNNNKSCRNMVPFGYRYCNKCKKYIKINPNQMNCGCNANVCKRKVFIAYVTRKACETVTEYQDVYKTTTKTKIRVILYTTTITDEQTVTQTGTVSWIEISTVTSINTQTITSSQTETKFQTTTLTESSTKTDTESILTTLTQLETTTQTKSTTTTETETESVPFTVTEFETVTELVIPPEPTTSSKISRTRNPLTLTPV
ncbi:hypothetical protein AYI69_g6652 [Smittium culicis]|uniref:Uncharacterized protein n=1 Tax=Smittium culicis TaxID=133412 RepID=A0A1R1XXF6_9FUNG|nr:hypothetical protein AYI69_g6652 [Smittium culicis]